ncbi:GTP cyclohydrolase II RibA [Enterovirga sp.]|uniref:GTP cyclohydrolase II RibA n=1 Tax=Enterovirga sp. TaxID=2026350 RepID=UPI002D1E0160|nr:GTP cyclohydrolase II RibA [Enterovirga sp.]HMO29686.1 GTP cyclohydrolase II RibA [Enterovirga sp.]
MRVTLSLSEPQARTSVERAIAEMRMARPVLLDDGGQGSVLVQGLEDLTPLHAAELDAVIGGGARLVLPAARLRRLGLTRTENGSVALPKVDCERIKTLAFEIEARIDAPVRPTEQLDEDALELARLALALPAVIVVPLCATVAADESILRVRADDIRGYRADQARTLTIVGRAPVPLEDALETEFVVFRGGEGLRDQIAVVVGKPDLSEPVTVRLHSACLTGDLFGSLKCDCGDQLRMSVRYMAEHGGGVLLYLDQEGRGNGIANKIRAYELQSRGYDTYDADEMLGFGPDQRRFDFAAAMLRLLGIRRVRLITNNPDKVEALTRAGITVAAHERVFGRTTPENRRYLASKRDRFGHLIELDAERPRRDR